MSWFKKAFSVWLAVLMLAALASCGGDEEEAAKKVADDTGVVGMHFSAPEAYETVERAIQKTTDGKLMSKGISYTISDDKSLAYAYTIAEGRKLEDEVKDNDKIETKEYNGVNIYIYKSGKKTRMAFYQDGESVYGVQYRTASEETIDDEFDKIMQNVKFTKDTETTLNNFKLDKVKYDVKADVPMYSESTNIVEKPDGTLVSKSYSWEYGKDSEKTEYRFGIDQYVNCKLEEKLSEKKEYEEVKVGDITYTVEKSDSAADEFDHYKFYVQQGEDVYVIQNKGVSNGWLVSRSDESKAAFKTFLQSVTFK